MDGWIKQGKYEELTLGSTINEIFTFPYANIPYLTTSVLTNSSGEVPYRANGHSLTTTGFTHNTFNGQYEWIAEGY